MECNQPWSSSPITPALFGIQARPDFYASFIDTSTPRNRRSDRVIQTSSTVKPRSTKKMPNSNRNNRQTSTTNLDPNFVVTLDPKQNKRLNKATRNFAPETAFGNEEDGTSMTEEHSVPASPSPSNDSLNQGALPSKRKDVEWINTIGGMIKTNSDKLVVDIYKKLDDNAKKVSKKINEVDKKQSEKTKGARQES